MKATCGKTGRDRASAGGRPGAFRDCGCAPCGRVRAYVLRSANEELAPVCGTGI